MKYERLWEKINDYCKACGGDPELLGNMPNAKKPIESAIFEAILLESQCCNEDRGEVLGEDIFRNPVHDPLHDVGRLSVAEVVRRSHATAVDKGWWDEPRSVLDTLCLMHSELSEACEEYRSGKELKEVYYGEKGKPEGFGIELADCVIRIADLCGRLGIDLDWMLVKKLEWNETRPYRHGGKKA